jgi:hypothetical protein
MENARSEDVSMMARARGKAKKAAPKKAKVPAKKLLQSQQISLR